MKALVRRIRSEESGQILVLVSVSMVVLFGLGALAADVGRLYLERQRLSAAADMAALAAVQFLPDQSAAEQAARDYLGKNGVSPDAAQIEVNGSAGEVAVAVNETIPMTFATVLGYERKGTWGGATARLAAISGVQGAVPLGVARADWVMGQQITLKLSANDGTIAPGNYQALALGKSGASMYEENLKNGYAGWIRVNQWLETQTGNMATPTVRAANDRINQDPQATWQTVKKGSPRLLMVPILRDWTVNGKGEVLVVGFGMFFLEDVRETGSDKGEITGRFLKMIGEGEADGTAPDFGLTTVKLVH